ncbi:hypothetical protein HCN44_010377 [Aphidius gifuensis]|uniref:Tetratricopeptide repeat protein 37 n=1 Tax=Aphidius gifuensis TaxID=684658 RepID=A0A834Y429_APHGI|nr:tetratricopeptide repeat protein 37 [Aphidius gifuensis]KAF7996121.1 hypothetical protein HCN44_010377 [Aphidius gifuensis]
MKQEDTASHVITLLLLLTSTDNEDEKRKINESLGTIFLCYPNLSQSFTDSYRSLLETVINYEGYPDRFELWKKLILILYSEKKYTALIATAEKMHHEYPRTLYPLEWICRIYTEQRILNEDKFDDVTNIEKIYNTILELDSNSSLGVFSKALYQQELGNILDSRDLLNQSVLINPQQPYAWISLIKVNAKLYCWSDVENAAQQAQTLLNTKSKHLMEIANDYLIEALANGENSSKWKQSITLCQKSLVQKSSEKHKLLLARAMIYLEDPKVYNLLTELENNPKTRVKATVLRAQLLKNQGKLEESIDVLGGVLETTDAWLLFGEINWEMSDYNHSLIAFLKGIHADPNNWECLVYLGHYYREYGNDLDKSRKCYQTALRINPNSDKAGAGLSTVYRFLKNSESNIQMLQRVTTVDGGGPKWAWLQLGLQQLDQREISLAIKSLRFVIRADPNNNHCWESLADAYWARGSHTSALKSYQRAADLSPDSLYPMIQLANINLVLGRHEEAKTAFIQILTHEKKYIPALKGLAETCLGLAVENLSNQLLGRAKRNIQQAVDSLTNAIVENSDFSCLWKLLGDACYRTAIMPLKYCCLDVVPSLVKSDSTQKKIVIERSQLFSLATRCYCRALSLSKDSSFLWHDLACCYFSQVNLDNNIDKKTIANQSMEAAKQAIRLNPTTWIHWNLLGVISMNSEVKNYSLAQHCWIMAIDREPNNAIAWTNLGTLYLYLNDPYMANTAFSRAQRADPDYNNSWIGQAIIAESIQRLEAMDLFRHAVELGYHPQAAIGYAHWILKTLLNSDAKKNPLFSYAIDKMHAIPVAADAMTWYMDRKPNSVIGRNILGLLLERQELYKPASREFTEALKFTDDNKKLDKIRINLTRVLVQMGDYKEAVAVCCGVKSPSFTSHCQLALSLFKAERYEESYEAYNDSLNDLAEDGSDKAHVLCAMASMAYMFQGVDDAKTLLFQCIQIQPPNVAGLLAAAALGLLHDDLNLTNLVLNELKPFKDDPNYRHHIAVLTAYSYLINNNHTGAIRIMSNAIHKYPVDVGSWIGLVRILLETNSKSFGNCAQKALLLGRNRGTMAISQVACISSLGQLMDNQNKSGLMSVEKTLMAFPGHIGSWGNFIFSLIQRFDQKSISNADWLLKLTKTIQEKLKSTKPMDDWLINNQQKLSALATIS